jgi:hypothetical protein
MKIKLALLFTLLFTGFNSTLAQDNTECKTKLSLFHEYAKSKNHDAAYEPWLYVYNNCPELNIAIYKNGEDILEAKIKQSEGEDKLNFLNRLLRLWKQRANYFPNDTKEGKYRAMACQLKYDHKDLFDKTDLELYNCFDETYKNDKTNFKKAKSLYTYFSLIVYMTAK